MMTLPNVDARGMPSAPAANGMMGMTQEKLAMDWQEPRGGDGEAEFDVAAQIRHWFGVLRRRKGLIAAIVASGLVGTYLIVDSMTPEYTATAQVMIESVERNVVDFQAVLGGVGSSPGIVASQVEVLRSRSMMRRLVDDLALIDDPEFNPYRRPPQESVFNLSNWLPDSWISSLGLDRAAPLPLPQDQQSQREHAIAIDILLSRLTIMPVLGTSVMDISFRSPSPEKAARLANALANLYILDQLEAKFEATEQANSWLSGRLEQLRQEVVTAEGLVAAYRTETNLGDLGAQSLIEQQLNQANAQLTGARAEQAAAQARYDQIQALLQSQGVNSAAEVLGNPLIISLRQREADAKRSLAELSTRYGDKHPNIINVLADIEDIQGTIASEVSKIVQNLANEVAVARARTRSIEQTLAELNERFNTERGASVKLRELERESEATRQLYDTMLARFKEVSEQEEIQQPDARVISMADLPRSPSHPKKTLIIIAATFGFVVLGTLVAILLESLNAGFRSLDQVTRTTGLAGLVEVPLLRRTSRKKPLDEIAKHPTSAFSEAVRSVQTALALSNVDNPPRSICLVSSVPEEGKTALSSALGSLMATGGHRVVLVDCDLRRPQLHRLLGAKRGPGLTEVLAGSHSIEDVTLKDDKSGLHILSAGFEVPNPHDLLQSSRMRQLVASLRERYDHVILDTPALLAVSDGLVVANLADATLMLVRWEKTPREVLQTSLRLLRSADARLAGVVMTQVDQRRQARYGYSSYGYYYGRYKNYYADS